MHVSRRSVLLAASSLATVPLIPSALAQPSLLAPTPQDSEGPFYPTNWSGEIDGDLITVGGRRYEKGESMLLTGRVLGIDGQAIRDARVEIWQVDAAGKYRHPNDDGDQPLKRGFQGFGRVATEASGGYRFRTVKPVNYGGRPAHIHYRVAAKGFRTLTTQMYFAGENEERSGFGGFSRERAKLTVKTQALRDAAAAAKLAAIFDIVLAKA